MQLRGVTLLAFGLALASPAAAAAQDAARPRPGQLPKDSMEIGRKYTQWLYSSQIDSLMAHEAGAKAEDAPARKAAYERDIANLAVRAGAETKVLDEKFITRNNMRQYWRTAQFSNMAEPLVLRFIITEKGELAGRGMNPQSQTPPIDP